MQINPGPPIIRIHPRQQWNIFQFREIWEYRELLYFLALRDISARYKQAVLSIAWAVVQPLFTMVVFSVLLGTWARMASDNLPYPLFAFTALVLWTFFANGVQQGANSLVSNANLVTKVYFPRVVIPMAGIVVGTLDFIIAFLVLLGLMAVYHVPLTLNFVFLPIFLLLAVVIMLGVSLWLAALNVQYRDVRYIVPFLVQVWLYLTPVVYPTSQISESLHTIYRLNPMTNAIEGFRWALIGTVPPQPIMLALSFLMAFVLLISGAMYFQQVEQSFADLV
jgi:lipopolysaccharide transport system permease protein